MKRDVGLLFLTRFLRLFAYGMIAIVLAQYLVALELPEWQVGALFTMTLWGDTAISLFITMVADRVGRRLMLVVGSALMVLAAAVFAATTNYWLLIIAATIGVISPNGKEVGPFLAIEQAALSDVVGDEKRTAVFGWYNVVGSFAGAIGAVAVGGFFWVLRQRGFDTMQSYRGVIWIYGIVGLVLWLVFACMSKRCEVQNRTVKVKVGLHKSRKTVFKLSGLFSIDAFAGGFIMQSLIAYWFAKYYGLNVEQLGLLFFCSEILAGISALVAVKMAKRFGLINTMVFTHLPSNILLILVPFMPTTWLAVLVYLLRCSISQMDVPTRQSYTMAVVDPDERSAAGGFTNIARTVGASLAPPVWGFIQMTPFTWAPLVISGSLKALYDILLYRSFKRLPAPEEMKLK